MPNMSDKNYNAWSYTENIWENIEFRIYLDVLSLYKIILKVKIGFLSVLEVYNMCISVASHTEFSADLFFSIHKADKVDSMWFIIFIYKT